MSSQEETINIETITNEVRDEKPHASYPIPSPELEVKQVGRPRGIKIECKRFSQLATMANIQLEYKELTRQQKKKLIINLLSSM